MVGTINQSRGASRDGREGGGAPYRGIHGSLLSSGVGGSLLSNRTCLVPPMADPGVDLGAFPPPLRAGGRWTGVPVDIGGSAVEARGAAGTRDVVDDVRVTSLFALLP